MRKLVIKAKHFKDAEYTSPMNCVLAIAGKEQFGEGVIEIVDIIGIGDIYYTHKEYKKDEFDKDKKKAEELEWSNKVIKSFTLKIMV